MERILYIQWLWCCIKGALGQKKCLAFQEQTKESLKHRPVMGMKLNVTTNPMSNLTECTMGSHGTGKVRTHGAQRSYVGNGSYKCFWKLTGSSLGWIQCSRYWLWPWATSHGHWQWHVYLRLVIVTKCSWLISLNSQAKQHHILRRHVLLWGPRTI